MGKRISAFAIVFTVTLSVLCAACPLSLAAEPTYTMSSQYVKSPYYENFSKIPLSGDQAADVVAVALSQLGYHEGDSNADLGGLNQKGSRDFVEYNVLYGKLDNGQGNGISYGYYWCASFVNWCLRQAGVSKSASGAAEVSCRRWLSACKDAGIYMGKKDYTPKSADLIFFKDAGSSVTSTHMGIVLYSDGERVYTVEGNTSTGGYNDDGDVVTTKSYSLSSSYIVGYATPKYRKAENVSRPDYSSALLSAGLYISEEKIQCYTDREMNGKVQLLDAYTVFRVEEICDGAFRLLLEKDGKETVLWAEITGKARQITADGKSYSVSFFSEDNEVFQRQYRLAGTPIYMPREDFAREDAGFVGWRRADDPTGKPIPSGTVLEAEVGDVVFHAVWDETLYEVVFRDADGTLIGTQKGYYGTKLEIPMADLPDGVEIRCWNEEIPDRITGNAVYIATYEQTRGDKNEDGADSVGCRAVMGTEAILAALVSALIGCFCKKRSYNRR